MYYVRPSSSRLLTLYVFLFTGHIFDGPTYFYLKISAGLEAPGGYIYLDEL